MGARRTTQIGGMTLAIGLGIAVTSGHGIAAAESTDTTNNTPDTTASPPDTGTDTNTQEAESTIENTLTTTTAAGTESNGTATTATVDRGRLHRIPTGIVMSSGGALLSERTKKRRDRDSDGTAVADNETEFDHGTQEFDAPRTPRRQRSADTSTFETSHGTPRDFVRDAVETAAPKVQDIGELPVSSIDALRATRRDTVSITIRATPAPFSHGTSPAVTAAAAPTAQLEPPTPPKLVAALFSVLGAGGPHALPGAPSVPVAPSPLELAWVAFRRVLFNRTPTAHVEFTRVTSEVITGTVVARDRDHDPLTYRIVDQPSHGEVEVDANGNFTYRPDPEYAHAGGGPDTFSIAVSDKSFHLHLFSHTEHKVVVPVQVTVPAANNDPTVTLSDVVDTGAGATGTVVTGDADDDPVTLSYSNPTHGVLTVTKQADNTYTYAYTPNAGYAHELAAGGSTALGTDTVTFTATDEYGGVATADANFTITPTNSEPDITASTVGSDPSDGSTTFKLVVTDSDAGDPRTLSQVVTQGRGSFTVIDDEDGTYVTYSPDRAHAHQGATTDVVTFSVSDGHGGYDTVNVEVAVPFLNDAPTIAVDPIGAIRETGVVEGTYTADDSEDEVTVVGHVDSAMGTVEVNPDTGTWTFTPSAPARSAAAKVGASDEARYTTISFAATDGFETTLTEVRVPVLAPDNQVIATVASPTANGVAVSADGTSVYIANSNGRITLIDATSNQARIIHQGTGFAEGIVRSPDGRYVYVMDKQRGELHVINTESNTIVTRTAPDDASLLTISSDGTRLYIGSLENDILYVTNTNGRTIEEISVGDAPRGVAISPDGQYVYVANSGANTNTTTPTSTTVSVISTADNTVVDTYEAGLGPYRVIVSPGTGDKLYVTNSGDGTVSVLAAADGAKLATIPVGEQPWGIAVTPDGTRLYVANHESDTVSVIDTASNTVIAEIPVGDAPINVAVSPDGTHVYVTNVDGGSVSVISVVPGAGEVVEL